MALNLEEKIWIRLSCGDRVLIRPKNPNHQTKSGLYLPPSAVERGVQSGYVIKTGPGFPIPALSDDDESWKRGPGNRLDMCPYRRSRAIWLFI